MTADPTVIPFPFLLQPLWEKLKARGPVPVGKVLDLRIEAEMVEWKNLSFAAEVMRCSGDPKQGFLVGLQFLKLEESTRSRLRQLASYLHEWQNTDITQRALGSTDHILQREPPPDPETPEPGLSES